MPDSSDVLATGIESSVAEFESIIFTQLEPVVFTQLESIIFTQLESVVFTQLESVVFTQLESVAVAAAIHADCEQWQLGRWQERR